MSTLLEIGETQSQGLESPSWLPGFTSGLKKSKNQHLITIYSDQEPYDNIKMEGTSLSFPKEDLPLERFIIDIRADVATVKTDVAVLKTDVRLLRESISTIPEMSKDIAILKNETGHINKKIEALPVMQTDLAILKNTVIGMHSWFRGLSITIIGGIIVGLVIIYLNRG